MPSTRKLTPERWKYPLKIYYSPVYYSHIGSLWPTVPQILASRPNEGGISVGAHSRRPPCFSVDKKIHSLAFGPRGPHCLRRRTEFDLPSGISSVLACLASPPPLECLLPASSVLGRCHVSFDLTSSFPSSRPQKANKEANKISERRTKKFSPKPALMLPLYRAS